MNTPPPRHILSIFIHALPAGIWATLTDDAKTPLFQHYNMTSTIDYEFGGTVEFFHAGQTVIVGRIVAFEPPGRLAMTFEARWSAEVEVDPPSKVTWEIVPAGPNASKVTVVHDGFTSETATFRGVSVGWAETLSRFKTLVETGQELVLDGYDAAAVA